jgi:hypothetical protein
MVGAGEEIGKFVVLDGVGYDVPVKRQVEGEDEEDEGEKYWEEEDSGVTVIGCTLFDTPFAVA